MKLRIASLSFVVGAAVALAAPITGVDSFAFSFSPLTTICQFSACTGSSSIPSSTLIFGYNAYGSADFGILRGYAQATVSGAGTAAGGVLASTNAYFVDGMTFSGMSAGTPGTVTFSFNVTGTKSFGAGAGGTVGVRVGLASDPIKGPPLLVPDANGNVTSQAIPFVFGQLLEIRATLFVDANIFTPTPGATSTWDYSHTATLNAFRVVDSSSAPITSFQVTSSSGTPYSASGVVPEPGTWMLMSVGLALGGAKLRQLRRP